MRGLADDETWFVRAAPHEVLVAWRAASARAASPRPSEGAEGDRPGRPGAKDVDVTWGDPCAVVRDATVVDQRHPRGAGADDFEQMSDDDIIDWGF